MKYMLLDTNIYLDMIVSRNNTNKAGSYDELVTLLNHDKVKLVVPSIVKEEVKRHLESEICNIGKIVKTARQSIKGMYWINHVELVEDFKKQISAVNEILGKMDDTFSNSKESFLHDSIEKIDVLFNHSNCIEIKENQKLMLGVQTRKLYKKCPEHIEGKNSDADALIIETLANIEDYITLQDDDVIYFITRNIADFSKGTKKEDKEQLHNDVLTDLELVGLKDRVEYRILFTKTIIDDFKDEAEGIIALQEMIEDLEIRKEAFEQQLIWDRINMDRESVGLSALSSDSSYFDEVRENQESYDFINMLTAEVDNYKDKLEEFLDLYYSAEEAINALSSVELVNKIEKYNDIYKVVPIEDYESESSYAVISYINTYIKDIGPLQGSVDSIRLEDCLELGNILDMKDTHGNKLEIIMTGNLDPRNDDTDTLYVDFIKNNNQIASGTIEIYYGYMSFDDGGNAADGSEESIDYWFNNLYQAISEIFELQLKDVQYANDKLEVFLDIMGIDY